MLFSNREYFLRTEPIDKNLQLQAQAFITKDEIIIQTFDTNEIVAIFTNKKILFVSDIKSKFFETELLPYSSISRCTVLGSYDMDYGKLEISVTDEIIIPFLFTEYKDAVNLCNKILSYIPTCCK